MEKILVTTDLSENSLASVRFAIQLATQRHTELIFLLVDELWDSTVYHAPAHAERMSRQKDKIQEELESVVRSVYDSMQVKPVNYSCVVHYHFGVVNSIMDYATRHRCDFICISTHGAGSLRKLMGSHSGELIKTSSIPVLCIPSNYIASPVRRILYASDMTNYEKELSCVIGFATTMGAAVDMINFYKNTAPAESAGAIAEMLKKIFSYDVVVYVEKMEDGTTLTENLDTAVERHVPSILVMFTNQERDFFEMLFLPSRSERYSFRTQVPMLVYNKTPE